MLKVLPCQHKRAVTFNPVNFTQQRKRGKAARLFLTTYSLQTGTPGLIASVQKHGGRVLINTFFENLYSSRKKYVVFSLLRELFIKYV